MARLLHVSSPDSGATTRLPAERIYERRLSSPFSPGTRARSPQTGFQHFDEQLVHSDRGPGGLLGVTGVRAQGNALFLQLRGVRRRRRHPILVVTMHPGPVLTNHLVGLSERGQTQEELHELRGRGAVVFIAATAKREVLTAILVVGGAASSAVFDHDDVVVVCVAVNTKGPR